MPPCPAPDVCWLYLVRHGATANNRARPPRLQGRRTDPELSEEGHRQARQTGRALADVTVGTGWLLVSNDQLPGINAAVTSSTSSKTPLTQ